MAWRGSSWSGLHPTPRCGWRWISRAALLRNREGLSYLPPACTSPSPFSDVPCSHWAAPWILEANRQGIIPGCGGTNFCPDNPPITRAQMAGYLARGYDLPITIPPATARTLDFAYTQGLLTEVKSGALTYGSLFYHPNLLVSQVTHANNVIETQTNDPNGMRRPAALTTSGPVPSASWSSGTYSYDGAGNIKSIGTAAFTYDKVNRLVAASLYDGPTGGGTLKQQSYAFDPYGNITSITTNGGSPRNTPTSTSTNRLTGVVGYDAAGNLTAWNGAAYQYDRFNQMTRMVSGSEDWSYIYTADDERLWSFSPNLSRWAIRDLGGKVLREYLSDTRGWTLGSDYIYRDGILLAAETQTGRRHFHLDHLGTPRLITRASGDRASYHVYYPFGEEATAFNQDTERMKFTGHERDLGNPSGAGDDLDYMHARHESPVTGRFLSTDVILGRPGRPQSWNRYAYTWGNPMRNIDPNGKVAIEASLVVVALAVLASIPALVHANRMASDAKYRNEVIKGARLTTETATAMVSSVLSKTTKKDKNEREYDVAGPLPSKENKGGGRGRFQTYEDAIDQLTGILDQQARIRKGQAEGVIDSVEKSLERVENALKDIIDPKDADVDPKDKPENEKNQSRKSQ